MYNKDKQSNIVYEDNNILIVTHGGVSKVIHAYFNGIPKDGVLERYKCDNCEIKTNLKSI